jgi:hypothetical protein
METDERISNAIVNLGRQFNKVLEMMDRKPRPNVENMSFDIINNSDVQRKERTNENPYQGKGEPGEETAKHVTTFTSRCDSDEDSCDEDVSYEEFVSSYKELYARSEEICKKEVKQKRIIAQ